MRKMRPQFDKVGWGSWPYPPETEKAAKYRSARALTHWGIGENDGVLVGQALVAMQATVKSARHEQHDEQRDLVLPIIAPKI